MLYIYSIIVTQSKIMDILIEAIIKVAVIAVFSYWITETAKDFQNLKREKNEKL